MTPRVKSYFYSALLSILALSICLSNPLHPFAKNYPTADSAFFLLVGKSMAQGMMPYTDFIDNKGPLIFIINWLGMLIGFTGTWLIEFMCIFFAVWLCYKTAKRFFSESASLLGTFGTFVAVFSWFEGGNFTEGYALPLLFAALYHLAGYFVQNFELKRIQVFASGACMGCVLMLRPNMIGVWVGMYAAIFIHSLLIRKFKILFEYIVFFIAGIIIAVLPFVVWLGATGLLYDFYRCTIEYNFMYYINVPLADIIKSMYHVFIEYRVIQLSSVIMAYVALRKKATSDSLYILNLSSICMFIATFLLSSLSAREYPHYYIVLLPCFIFPISLASEILINMKNVKPVIVLIAIILILNKPLRTCVKDIKCTMRQNISLTYVASFIEENTEQDEQILCIVNCSDVYLMSKRHPAGRYPIYIYADMNYSTLIKDYLDELASKKPRLIVYKIRIKDQRQKIVEDYIADNYTCIYENDIFKVYRLLEMPFNSR